MIDKNSGKYNASSPDEQALVQGAKDCGFTFTNRSKQGAFTYISIKLSDGTTEKYQFLGELEFDSTRKRMSVILR
jgi:magnesium-transporting ATPase (P-type)